MPITFHENINEDTTIGLWKITETPEDLEHRLQLKNHELTLLRSLSKEKRNLHWLATRVLLRKMLNTNEYIDCQADENGKPILINHPHHISLSHSYDYAAVMVSKTKKVGIDIEIIKDKIIRVQQKFLSDDELAFINNENRTEHLYVCWCAKEALYKLNGKKETSFRNHIHLSPFNYAENGNLNANIDKAGQKEVYQVEFRRFEDYMLGYVCGQ
ncbi:MAG: 4'-phosphopantetheinyl transferase superfamily protein [Bacteroidetes bacterium]|nr:4'-phosphopantetheinyl transferase superfamily protein [Bacteroidota bacterium]MBU1371546.1 4'-phosphopantetheinyl transferase superfamily protein [Bacteroidota bacterium]MBU1486128.1 4'-phosphopantetheinyl transferase superfamily protein [Bacteroidota bacterium]MBU1759767.1 4'-phosphopantetheinyl transferase superfamily protein [Bacteroidota bacterium]MBU2269529.1 4'-phosphopantetheinyl transferase superfamily protein [Bacteroidota bacterium]